MGIRAIPDLHTSLVTLNGTADVLWFMLPKQRKNYTCYRDDYKRKNIPPKSHKMAQTEHARLKIGTGLKLQLFI